MHSNAPTPLHTQDYIRYLLSKPWDNIGEIMLPLLVEEEEKEEPEEEEEAIPDDSQQSKKSNFKPGFWTTDDIDDEDNDVIRSTSTSRAISARMRDGKLAMPTDIQLASDQYDELEHRINKTREEEKKRMAVLKRKEEAARMTEVNQSRMEKVWQDLKMPEKERLDMAIKYGGDDFAPKLGKVNIHIYNRSYLI